LRGNPRDGPHRHLSLARDSSRARGRDFGPSKWRLIRIAAWAVLLHLLQIIVWALVYAWQGAMPDLTSAAYFSTVTYTTTGYGDLVLPPRNGGSSAASKRSSPR
jgi:hypothetical protein